MGATGTVTGSRTLLTYRGQQWLVDCGLFQGFKHLRQRNWRPLPVDPKTISAVVLTHAHIDHSGYLPRLVRDGFNGPIYSTHATRDLAAILLRDSAFLLEEDARYANNKGFSKHRPALPLYTRADAEAAIRLFKGVPWDRQVDVGPGASFRFLPAGHIPGAALVKWDLGGRTVLFTGDLGRPNDPLMRPPTPFPGPIDYLVLESTYGNRVHDARDPRVLLADAILPTLERKGVVLVPAFAVARSQLLFHLLVEMRRRRMIPKVPVVLNSPMAASVTRLYEKYQDEHRLTRQESQAMCSLPRFVQSVQESKDLNSAGGPLIIVSASGMATGGRVVHHLKHLAPNRKNLILFVGYQAGGTRGASILRGEPSVKIHGEFVPIKARVRLVDNLSAHADWKETLAWLERAKAPPKKTWLVHGEPDSTEALRHRIQERLGWDVDAAEDGGEAMLE